MSPSPSTPLASRDVFLDTLRGWSIFGVICVHFAGSFVTTDIYVWSPSFHLGLWLNQGFSFAVPLFVFLSGYLAGLSRSQTGIWTYYRVRLWRIGMPYLAASVASFFLLNHFAAWQNLPGLRDRLAWLLQHLAFYGVEPTLYFIPLIIQLYLLQPLLKSLPAQLSRLLPSISTTVFAAAITLLLLALHVVLGLKCYNGSLNYYVWGRPNVLFWIFYFFAGLHLPTLLRLVPRRALVLLAVVGAVTAVGAMAWNAVQLLDPAVVGVRFELNRLDFAYARPEMLLYDAAVVLALAAGLGLGWAPRRTPITYLGRFTLEIYLWHILVLYFGVWKYPAALAACREMPELIVCICFGAAFVIASIADGQARLREYVRRHRFVIVRVD